MADVLIRLTTDEDIPLLATNMRAADQDEVRASGHNNIEWAVTRSVRASLLCWSAFVDGELACILGAAPLSVVSGIGSPWMLGTPVLDANARILVRETPRYISKMQTAFPHLLNFVHADNKTSVRWLRRLGFTLSDPQPHPTTGALFHRFDLKA